MELVVFKPYPLWTQLLFRFLLCEAPKGNTTFQSNFDLDFMLWEDDRRTNQPTEFWGGDLRI